MMYINPPVLALNHYHLTANTPCFGLRKPSVTNSPSFSFLFSFTPFFSLLTLLLLIPTLCLAPQTELPSHHMFSE
jgi:hypothetical protein